MSSRSLAMQNHESTRTKATEGMLGLRAVQGNCAGIYKQLSRIKYNGRKKIETFSAHKSMGQVEGIKIMCCVVVRKWQCEERVGINQRSKRPKKIPCSIRRTTGNMLSMAGHCATWRVEARRLIITASAIGFSVGSLRQRPRRRCRRTWMTYFSCMSAPGSERCPTSEAILYLETALRNFFMGREVYAMWMTPDKRRMGSRAARDGVHLFENWCQPSTVSMAELHQTAPSNSRRLERTRTHWGGNPGT